MVDSEKTEKSGKWRKFWNCYQQELFAVFLVFCVIALLDDRDITDYLELLWKTPGFRDRTAGTAVFGLPAVCIW